MPWKEKDCYGTKKKNSLSRPRNAQISARCAESMESVGKQVTSGKIASEKTEACRTEAAALSTHMQKQHLSSRLLFLQ